MSFPRADVRNALRFHQLPVTGVACVLGLTPPQALAPCQQCLVDIRREIGKQPNLIGGKTAGLGSINDQDTNSAASRAM